MRENCKIAPRALRVGIDGRILMRYEMRGLARYTVELFLAMKEIVGEDLELFSFSPGPMASEFRSALDLEPIVFPAGRELLWEHYELPRQLVKHGIEIFHATAERGLPFRRVCKYVVTRHDIIDRLPAFCGDEHWRGKLRKRIADFVTVRQSDKILTVSEFSRKDICRFYGLAPERVVVAYNAAHPRFYAKASHDEICQIRSRYGLPEQYFLFLGGFDKKKNVVSLVEAYALLPSDAPVLVLAGELKWEFSAVRERIDQLGLSGRVICPGTIDDAYVPAVYQGAMAFVHPSRYEGFGLQLVEAMASGVPVLASDCTSLPEVLGGCGLLFDPLKPETIARQMEEIWRDPELRSSLIESGRKRAQMFSWRNTAQQTLALYQGMLGREAQFAGSEAPVAEAEMAG